MADLNNWADQLHRMLCAQAAWLVEESSLTSRRELVAWIMPLLSKAAAKELETLLPFNTLAQLRAEKMLAEFLTARELNTEVLRYRQAVQSGPTTDWAHTYAQALFDPPLMYSEVIMVEELDLEVMCSLVTLAQQWQQLLERISMPTHIGVQQRAALKERAGRLKSALKHARPAWWRVRALDERKLKRLERQAPKLAVALRDALYYWGSKRSCEDAKAFHQALLSAIKREKSANVSDDRLLEIALMWSIPRAVMGVKSPDPNDGSACWKLARDPLGLTITNPDKYGVSLSLVCGKLRCSITKGHPRKCIEAVSNYMPLVDRAACIGRSHDPDITGFEPDLVFHFTHEDHPGHLFAFGDAKNYQKASIMGAIKETGISHLFAFAPLFGSPKYRTSPFDIEVAIRPAITLFFPKGVTNIANVDASDFEGLEDLFLNQKYLPPVMCMDRRHFLDQTFLSAGQQAPGEAQGTEDSAADALLDTWDAPIIRAWFKRLTRDVHEAFVDGRAFMPTQDADVYHADTAQILYIPPLASTY